MDASTVMFSPATRPWMQRSTSASPRVRIKGRPGFSSLGVNTYVIWFDAATGLPVRVKALGPEGKVVEEVYMEDLHTGVELPDTLFTIE